MSHKSPATSAPILQMNSLAPAVKVREWVSGEPLAMFQPGKLYILEFVEPRVNLVRGALRDLIESQETYKGSGVEVAAVAVQRAAPADEDRSKIDAWLPKSRR